MQLLIYHLLMTNRISLFRNQTLQSPETSLACSRVLPCLLLKLQKLRHMQTLLKMLILLFYVHIPCWLSQQRCQFFTLISCPSLFIQSFKNPDTAKNYRRKEQTTVYLFERSIVHNIAASQASRLMYNCMQNASFSSSPTSPLLRAWLLITARWQDKIKGRKGAGETKGWQLQKEAVVLWRVTFQHLLLEHLRLMIMQRKKKSVDILVISIYSAYFLNNKMIKYHNGMITQK